jgi:hypothetical protein
MAKRPHMKTFPCGHKGKGQYCHLCDQKNRARQEAQTRRNTRRQQQHAWRETFANDPIDLRILPKQHLVEQARSILTAIQAGIHYHRFGGKHLRQNRHIISIPLNIDYRLIFRKTNTGLIPLRCDSHETYNKQRYT